MSLHHVPGMFYGGIGDLSDVLSDVLDESLGYYPHLHGALVTGRPTRGSSAYSQSVSKKWTHKLDCRGYAPQEIELKPEDGQIRIHARHFRGDEDNSNCYEMNRLINLPEGVHPEKVTSHLLSNGILILEAPRIPRQNEEKSIEIQGVVDPELKVVEKDGKKCVQARIHAAGFEPSEINIKCRGNRVIVDAKHEEQSEGHIVYRELMKTYNLPEGVNPDELTAGFDDKDYLMLCAPYNPPEVPEERSVPIMEEEPAKAVKSQPENVDKMEN